MRISVYCSSAPDIDPTYLELAHDLGVAIGNEGWDLVWGGGAISMMGAVARGVRSTGRQTVGVIPEKLLALEIEDKEATELHVVSDMRSRKAKIEDLADAFIVLPGGIGTLEEFFEIWVGRYLQFHAKPIAVCDPYGAFSPLKQAMDHLTELKFMKPGQDHLVTWSDSIAGAIASFK
jgi:uncharacterized protein (TIGR00730 family)